MSLSDLYMPMPAGGVRGRVILGEWPAPPRPLTQARLEQRRNRPAWKYSEEAAAAIRQLSLAEARFRYGVSSSHYYRIKNGETS